MTELAHAALAAAGAVLLLGAVIAAAQWILRRIYGESSAGTGADDVKPHL